MNNKLKFIVNVLPVVLVPLFLGRKKIKEHPDIEKLSDASKSAYTTVKDKSIDTAGTIKDKSVSAYETGRHTYDVVSDKVSETKHSIQEKREARKQLKEEKAEEKRKNQLKEEHSLSLTDIPKMMKSHTSLSNEEKMRGMLVSDKVLHTSPLLLEAGYKEINSNHPAIYDYDKDISSDDDASFDEEQLALTVQSFDDTLNKEENNHAEEEKDMTHINNVQEEYFNRVKGHEKNIEAFNNSHLFLRHRESLAPNLKTEDESTVLEHSALFQRHREQAESHIEKMGRRTSIDSNMKRSKHQKKLDSKLKKVR